MKRTFPELTLDQVEALCLKQNARLARLKDAAASVLKVGNTQRQQFAALKELKKALDFAAFAGGRKAP